MVITNIAPSLPEKPNAELQPLQLNSSDEALLQHFFSTNPEFFLATTGAPARYDEAAQEMAELPPVSWSFSERYLIGYRSHTGALVAFTNIIRDLFSLGIWHISTFIVDSARHGNGDASMIYRSLERWAIQQGAQWIRLGVAHTTPKARHFWTNQGYIELRQRDVTLGKQLNTLSIMCKPLVPMATIENYLTLVTRDRSDEIS